MGSIMMSKENLVLERFYNYPTKHWHFNELAVDIAESKLDRWLKRFQKQKIIIRVKKTGSMPFYISNHQNPEYQNRKRIFGLSMLHESGLLNHLSLSKARNVVLFGSLTRWDWYSESDIDIFVFGNSDDIEIRQYETKLNREIHLFEAKNLQDLRMIGGALLKSIISGYVVKGEIDFAKVVVNDKILEPGGSIEDVQRRWNSHLNRRNKLRKSQKSTNHSKRGL